MTLQGACFDAIYHTPECVTLTNFNVREAMTRSEPVMHIDAAVCL